MTKEKYNKLVNGLNSIEPSSELEKLMIDYCICEHSKKYYSKRAEEITEKILAEYTEEQLNAATLEIHNKTKDL